ncbi:glycosyltransferase 61 family protein [Donghicola mangrovi]|uniref:Glycosyltransferase family 61 protein n=1 Tax=Donghicola mangrovi TaxID=2729614 RepID=A0A850QI55_9RHOB|nr:glycosyltransferase 61 family protein [Donghicola mangrovi]NVO25471.1 glycosyltransferase family 61 protein [Donghicola mangrovi]
MVQSVISEVENRKNIVVYPHVSTFSGGPEAAGRPWHADKFVLGKPINAFAVTNENLKVERKLEGHYLYGGPLKMHFGHFIIDALPRLYAYDQSYDGVVFSCFQNEKFTPGFIFEFCELAGVPKEKVFFLRTSHLVQSLDFPFPGLRAGMMPESWYLKWLEKHFPPDSTIPEPFLFYGRTHLANKGSLIGEGYFSKMLQDNGFVYTRPEDSPSIRSQVAMITRAKKIVFTEGSAIHGIDLCGSVGNSIFMIPRRPRGDLIFGPSISSRASFFYLGHSATIVRTVGRNGKNGPNSPSYCLNPDSIFSEMKAHDLVMGQFSLRDFLIFERREAEKYWEDTVVAEQELQKIQTMRAECFN